MGSYAIPTGKPPVLFMPSYQQNYAIPTPTPEKRARLLPRYGLPGPGVPHTVPEWLKASPLAFRAPLRISGLGQTSPGAAQTVVLGRQEAEAFASSLAGTIQYLAENMATARTFCPSPVIAAEAAAAGGELARLRKVLDSGQASVPVSVAMLLAAASLGDCANKVGRHMDLVTGIALFGNSISTWSGFLFDLPFLVYGGLILSVIVQTVGPVVKLPFLED